LYPGSTSRAVPQDTHPEEGVHGTAGSRYRRANNSLGQWAAGRGAQQQVFTSY